MQGEDWLYSRGRRKREKTKNENGTAKLETR